MPECFVAKVRHVAFSGILLLFIVLYNSFGHFYGPLWHFLELWPYTLFCEEFTLFSIYTLFLGKIIFAQNLLVYFFLSFSMSGAVTTK